MKNNAVLSPDYRCVTHVTTLENEFQGVYATDLLSAAIKSAEHKSALITLISHDNTVACAMMMDCPLIIISSGRLVTSTMIEKANEENICLMMTDLHTHEVIKDFVMRGLL